jgi:hypothetical protein
VTAQDLLKRQHREMRELVVRTRGLGSVEARVRARNDLARLVRAHTSMVEEHVYAKLEAVEETADLAEDSFHAHELLIDVLAELDRLSPDDAEFAPVLDELDDLLAEHLAIEERRVLPWLAAHWSREEVEALGEQMAARYEELRTSGQRPPSEMGPEA